MARRPALLTQADIARAIRAAKQEGAREVEVHIGDKAAIVIKLASSTSPESVLEQSESAGQKALGAACVPPSAPPSSMRNIALPSPKSRRCGRRAQRAARLLG